MLGDRPRQLGADRSQVGVDGEPGQPVVVVREHDRPRSSSSTWRATNSASEPWIGSPSMLPRPGRGDDRDVGAEVAQDPGPVAGRVLVQQRCRRACRTGRRARRRRRGRPAARATRWSSDSRDSPVEKCRAEFCEPRALFLPRHPEIADAHLAGLAHLTMRPDAGVLARVHRDLHGRPTERRFRRPPRRSSGRPAPPPAP